MRESMMRESEHLMDDMTFQLSLLRLVTVPHQDRTAQSGAVQEEEQMERLQHLASAIHHN